LKTRLLGKSGIRVSEIGLGCWQLGGDFGPVGEDRAQAILREADENSISFWDTADVYGDGLSELRIARHVEASKSRPVIATKVGRHPRLYPKGYTKENVRTNIEGSARRLGVDALDLVQLHCVPPEVLKAGDIIAWMEDFQDQGLIRSFGASVETIEEAIMAAQSPRMVSLQIIFNIFRQDAIESLFPLAEANDVGIIVRLPLASGVLSGKMTRDQKFAETDHRHYNRHGEAFSVGETFFRSTVRISDRAGARAEAAGAGGDDDGPDGDALDSRLPRRHYGDRRREPPGASRRECERERPRAAIAAAASQARRVLPPQGQTRDPGPGLKARNRRCRSPRRRKAQRTRLSVCSLDGDCGRPSGRAQ
jgi:aryl-alcohol dehydrogenase-like predicted oxidoreductase